jgi:hypothetical protein
MYLWSLLGTDLSAGPASSGITADAASAMRLSEPEVANGNAFLAIIEEVRPRISVGGLETIYASTGRHWIGRRTRGRGVFWEAKRRTVDPAEVYLADDPGACWRALSQTRREPGWAEHPSPEHR